MTPDLAETVIEHIDGLRRADRDVGARRTWSRTFAAVAWTASASARSFARRPSSRASTTSRASCRRCRTRRRSLRRTYISIAPLANDLDVKWVMSPQPPSTIGPRVGHEAKIGPIFGSPESLSERRRTKDTPRFAGLLCHGESQTRTNCLLFRIFSASTNEGGHWATR